MGDRVTTVSSSVYNMAGDIQKRPNVLKSVIVGAVLEADNLPFGKIIPQSYLHGSGIKLRTFIRWTENSGYNTVVGGTASKIVAKATINDELLAAQIPHAANETIIIMHWGIVTNNPQASARKYVLTHFPLFYRTLWVADYSVSTNIITITFENGTEVSYTPTDFIYGQEYLHIHYYSVLANEPVSSNTGSIVTLSNLSEFASTTGWTVVHEITAPGTTIPLVQTTTTTKVYSDGRANEITVTTVTSNSDPYTDINNEYTNSIYLGGTTTFEVRSSNDTRYDLQSGNAVDQPPIIVIDPAVDIGGGVTYVATHSIVNQILSVAITTQTNTAIVANFIKTDEQIFSYSADSGNPVLDALFTTSIVSGTFFPYIPVRINNVFVDQAPYVTDIYPVAKRAFKKATGRNKFDKVIENLNDNAQIAEIDYAYIVFGVSLNSVENVAKKYLFSFFELMFDAAGGNNAYLQELAQQQIIDANNAASDAWWEAQQDSGNPLYGLTHRIFERSSKGFGGGRITIGSSNNPVMNYNMSISWNALFKTVGTGLAKVGAKTNEVWIGTPPVTLPFEGITFIWQINIDSWKSITIAGLSHHNPIYDGKAVTISGNEALADVEESGFIIPLHSEVFRGMSLVDSTQLATSCMYLVINTYQSRKKKWYESGWFKFILVVVAIIVTISTGGFTATGAGLLGTNGAVGTTLGLSGTAAVIAGVAANAIAAMILLKLIKVAAIKLLGDELGAIIGAIVGIAMMTFVLSGNNFTEMFSPKSLLQMTKAAGDEYQKYLYKKTGDVIKDTEKLMADYKKKKKEIDAKFAEEFGTDGRAVIDPLVFLHRESNNTNFETADAFIARTLMSGSDIVDLTMGSITNFTQMTLPNT